MSLVDAIQQYQAIIYEIGLGDNLISLQARRDLPVLRAFLTKELGSVALKSLTQEAEGKATRHR